MYLNSSVGGLVEPLSDRRWSPAEISAQLAHRTAWLLAQGIERGDRVLLHHGNTIEFFVDLLSVWQLGACAIPVDARLTAFEVANLARVAAPRAGLWRDAPDAGIAERLEGQGVRTLVVPASGAAGSRTHGSLPRLDDPALVLFTSGTTGEPKGVVHTHRSLRARWIGLQQALGLHAFRRTLCLLPSHFGHGLICNSLYPWLGGHSLAILPPFHPSILGQLGAILDEHEITFMSSVPSVWKLALRMAKPPARGTLERVFCGSAPLSAHLWQGAQQWTGTREVWNAYGITETGSWVAGSSGAELPPEDGRIGQPWGAVAKVLNSDSTNLPPERSAECAPGETGYLWLNTPALMQGYFQRDDLTAQVVAGGWFFTGDLASADERGQLYLRGRVREEINKGGTKVHPADIDAVAERDSRALDVCTFAYEDPLYGENVGIALVLRDGAAGQLPAMVQAMREQLAEFQMPQRWYVLPEIPRTSRGKINRATVAVACAGMSPANPGDP